MNGLTGTAPLLRFALRRDRWMLLAWIAGGVLLYWSQAVSTVSLYPSQADLDKAANSMVDNPAFVALAGPTRALDTIGGQVAWQASAFGAVVAALMSMFLLTRHTRAEEESGRDELMRASAIGRQAPLVVAASVVVLANVLLAAGIAVSLLPYVPLAGSLALGVGAGLCGVVFGAVALVAAQVVESTRAANGIAGAAIAVAFGARAIGDVTESGLSWASPIGWMQAMRPFADERWWPVVLFVGASAVLGFVAVVMFERRDVGAGLRAARPGPDRGKTVSLPALAWRLQRTSVVAWVVSVFVAGLAYGSIGDAAEDMIGDSQLSQDVFARADASLLDSFYAVAVLMLVLIGSAFAVTSVLRLRGEESDGHAEALLATGVSRRTWVASHLLVTVVGAAAIVLAAGSGVGVGYALATGDASAVTRFTVAAAQYLAPVLLLAAVTFAGFAVRSALGLAGWVLLGFSFVVLMFGTAMRMPAWLRSLSPFDAMASVPAEPFALAPTVISAVVAVVLVVVGSVAIGARDVG